MAWKSEIKKKPQTNFPRPENHHQQIQFPIALNPTTVLVVTINRSQFKAHGQTFSYRIGHRRQRTSPMEEGMTARGFRRTEPLRLPPRRAVLLAVQDPILARPPWSPPWHAGHEAAIPSVLGEKRRITASRLSGKEAFLANPDVLWVTTSGKHKRGYWACFCSGLRDEVKIFLQG